MENSTDAESLNVTTVSLKFNDTTQSYEADTSNPQDETDNDLNIASTICEGNLYSFSGAHNTLYVACMLCSKCHFHM